MVTVVANNKLKHFFFGKLLWIKLPWVVYILLSFTFCILSDCLISACDVVQWSVYRALQDSRCILVRRDECRCISMKVTYVGFYVAAKMIRGKTKQHFPNLYENFVVYSISLFFKAVGV